MRTFVAVGALAALMMSAGDQAGGQVSPLQIIPLAQGSSTDRQVDLKVRGPNDALQTLLVFQPGADTGWHSHPGPVVVVVKTGTVTEQNADGCFVVHPAGTVFFEQKGEVHRAFNNGGTVSEAYATFLMPSGAQPLVPASDPGVACRGR
jgi:quercetin dioxygenase-like cupin family protein